MKRKIITNISDYYLNKAILDKKSGEILAKQGLYSSAIYFEIQFMEKLIKSEICKKINLKIKYTHELVNNHSIKDLMFLLIDIVVTEENMKKQLKVQINNFLGNIEYNRLYNNLRYPYYSKKNKEFLFVDYDEEDYKQIVKNSLNLKYYLRDFYKI